LDPVSQSHVFDAGALISKDHKVAPVLGADRVKWWAESFVNTEPCVLGEFKAKVMEPFLTSYVPTTDCPSLVKSVYEQHDPTGKYSKKCLPMASSEMLTQQVVGKLGGTDMDPEGTVCAKDPLTPRCQVAQHFDDIQKAYCAQNNGDPRCSCYNRYDPFGLYDALSAIAPGARPECWWAPCQDSQFYRNFLAREHPVGGACGDPPPECANIAIFLNNKNLVVGDFDQYISGCGSPENKVKGILDYWPEALIGVAALTLLGALAYYLKTRKK
jgi:hypothetical protein